MSSKRIINFSPGPAKMPPSVRFEQLYIHVLYKSMKWKILI